MIVVPIPNAGVVMLPARGTRSLKLVDAVSALSHDNWSLRGPGDKSIASSRAEFFDLPRVKNVLKWAKDGRAEA